MDVLGKGDALLASVIRASLDGIVVVDHDSQVLEWNPAAEEMFGWRRDEAVGRCISDLIIPDQHHDAHHAGMARYLGGGAPRVLNRRVEVPARRKDGREIPVELAITEVTVGEQRLFTASLRDLSALNEARRALEESEAKLSAFFQHAPAAMFIKSRDGRYERVNEFTGRLMERPAEEIIGRRAAEVFPPSTADMAETMDRRVIETGEPQVQEAPYDVGSGTRHTLTARFPIRDRADEISHVGVVIIDISDRVAAEQQLRDSEARLSALLDHAPLTMYLKDRDDRYCVANRFMAQQVGRTPEELKRMTPRDLLPPASADEAAAVDRIIIETRQPHVRENEFMSVEGLKSAVTVRFPVFDQAGEVAYIGGVFLDTTAAKTMERALRESEARLNAFVRNAPMTMFVKDREGRYILANEQTARNLGTTVEAMIGRTAAEIAPRVVAEAGQEAEAEILRTGQARTEVQSFDLPVGKVWGLNTRFPIPDASGALTQIGGVFVDITAQKEAEEELQRSREALLQSEKMNALGSLLAGVSHELNNPLAIVVGESILLEEDAEGTPAADSAGRIKRAAERCSRIVQTFLAMARQKEPERRRVSPTEVVTAALDLAEYGLRSNGIEVVRKFEAELPDLWADPDQLVQVVLNLLVNAQQALQTVAAPRCLTLRLQRGEKGQVRFEVADNGPGVAEDVSRRIFDPFFTTKPQGTGTGIGLSFSQGIAEAHGGSLRLVRHAEPGATFRLELPVAGDEATDDAEPHVEEEPARRRVLVVDDEPELAETLCRLLKSDGLEVEVAIGGAEAIRRLEQEEFDLILSDLRMPDVDGPSLHAWLKAERPAMERRIGFVTGDTLGPAAVSFFRKSGRPYLEKPFTREGIRRLLASLDAALLDEAG